MTTPPAGTGLPVLDTLALDGLARGQLHRLRVALTRDGTAAAIQLPVLVAHGALPGPTVGVTAAVHGNELNGIPTIHRLFRSFTPDTLSGTVVAVPIANLPGYLANTREFRDGRDLNRLFPGKPDGNEAQVYAHALMERVIARFDFLFDLHTASFGRVNSLYIRADMGDPVVARFARLIGPQIVVHNPRGDGTLRGAAAARGIRALTVEVGDPQRIQRRMTKTSGLGLRNVLEDLGMLAPDEWEGDQHPLECTGSYWTYTDAGGFLEVVADLTERVQAGDVVAHLYDPWGQLVCDYAAPEDGVIIGKSTNPVAHTGSRIVHLGVVAREDERLNVGA